MFRARGNVKCACVLHMYQAPGMKYPYFQTKYVTTSDTQHNVQPDFNSNIMVDPTNHGAP